jgi:ketosteroid isomerase-like protein
MRDHRRVPVSSFVGEGPDAFVASVATFWELAPDVRFELVRGPIAYNRLGVVGVLRSSGTLPDGGPFENYLVNVAAVEGGRITRFENFELEDLDAALACFRALRPSVLQIPPNAATRWTERMHDAFHRRDWQAIEQMLAPSLLFDDRRRTLRLTGGRDLMLESMRLIATRPTIRVTGTVLATAGDRVALHRLRWSGGTPGSEFEVEYLGVVEVDAEGHLTASISFDLDDHRAASRELFERFARIDVVPRRPPAETDLLLAFLDHDLARCRAILPADFVMDDHRRTGMGRIEGADAYMEAVAALFDQAPDAVVEPLYEVARGEHGVLNVARTFGTLAEGGEFESVYVWLAHYDADRFVGAELFEVEDLDTARVRFEELRSGRPGPRARPLRALRR